MTWNLGTTNQEHLDEHNAFDHAAIASPASGKILGESGGLWAPVDLVKKARRITVTGPMLVDDGTILVNSNAGPVTVNLLALSVCNLSAIVVKRVGTNAVTVDPNGTELINTNGSTQATKVLGSDGAHWSGIASSADGAWITVGENGTVT